MKAAVLIPARYASSRFPGKPLAEIAGAHGRRRPLIERTWHAAGGKFPVYILTDDERIAAAAKQFGAEVLMTPATCANGTERCAAALAELPEEIDFLVNIQGDSPLVPPGLPERLLAHLAARPKADVATPMFAAPPPVRRRMIADAEAGRTGGTSVVVAADGRALYFSKRLLPYGVERDPNVPLMLHLGVYAYRRQALAAYPGLPACGLERAEGLEQLRFLSAGMAVETMEIDPIEDFWEVNNPGDVAIVEAALAARGAD